MFNVIVAYDKERGIGKNNTIPWMIKSDLQYFKKVTSYSNNPILRNVVIMGRHTWESIPSKYRPLSQRLNIILTRNKDYTLDINEGIVYHSLDTIINDISSKILKDVNYDNIFIMGGSELYKTIFTEYNHLVKKLYITEIYDTFECDTHFPEISDTFKLTSVSKFLWDTNREIHKNIKKVYYRKLVYINSKFNVYNTYEFLWTNTEENQYIQCLKDIVSIGIDSDDRTGVGTLSTFGNIFKYNLNDTFPLLTTKKMFVRGIFEELLFYLSGKTDNSILNKKKISIWNGNTTRDFLDKRGLSHYPEGDMGETYGFNFRHYGAEYKTCKEDYTGQGYDQLANVIDLIKNDPGSRRIIIDLWNCSTLHKAALPSCLCKYQFYVNSVSNTLDLMIYIRSSDFFLANNWNTCTGAFLVHMICNLKGIDLTPGILTVITGDTHIYKTHIDQVKENIKREPRPFPKLIIKNKKENITDFEYSDIILLGYNPMPNISAQMAV